ncbi:MAG: DUF368 domain-containing protein [Bacteroidia bacterium]|nr:DUF368 domain-containing protein [Bacteroidia bacterium]NNC84876.1 DUF368 domain-containing protein [Bacteroidia bacterium]
MQRSLYDYGKITLKGLAMGAADIVPGVSGGTIAFITNIYEELLDSLKSIDHNALKVLFKEGIPTFWKHINGNFLAALFLGVGISLLSLAKIIKFLLAAYPELLWAFFFGLIVASTIVIGRKIKKIEFGHIIAFILGTVIAYAITVLSPTNTTEAYWFIFVSGMIAICAMILPGISGSFILLLLGKYAFIVDSISELRIEILALFAAGCGIGLLSFSHVLSWMLKKYHDITIALLTGFMLGSLNKVWPWKFTESWRTNSKGEEVPLIQSNVFPQNYDGEAMLIPAILIAILGFAVIIFIERLSASNQK